MKTTQAKIPGFTAEASLLNRGVRPQTARADNSDDPKTRNKIYPQTDFSCRWSSGRCKEYHLPFGWGSGLARKDCTTQGGSFVSGTCPPAGSGPTPPCHASGASCADGAACCTGTCQPNCSSTAGHWAFFPFPHWVDGATLCSDPTCQP